MANTYTQCYIHLVFSPSNRDACFYAEMREELQKYITSIIQNNKHKLLAIKAMSDHIHILIGYNVSETMPHLVNEIKTSSTKWIKEKKFFKGAFSWQNGYGAFSHSRSQIDTVIRYIMNQEDHHKKKPFREEYLEILKNNDIEFDEKYVFEFFE